MKGRSLSTSRSAEDAAGRAVMDEKISNDELYELRALLDKLKQEPDMHDFVETWINGVLTYTSVVLDMRREKGAEK